MAGRCLKDAENGPIAHLGCVPRQFVDHGSTSSGVGAVGKGGAIHFASTDIKVNPRPHRARNWLAAAPQRKTIPSAARVQARYRRFQAALEALSEEMALDQGDNEFATVTSLSLRQSEALLA